MNSIKNNRRKSGILLNYISILIFITTFYIGKSYGFGWKMVVSLVISLGIGVVTFVFFHLKSGLWRFVHSKSKSLDERELQISLGALKSAYSLFTVIILAVLLAAEIFFDGGIGIVAIAGFIYFAHTLPGAVLIWQRNYI